MMSSLYHLSVAVKNNAVDRSAYISGLELYSERDGRKYRYGKEEVVAHGILLPDNTPVEFQGRYALWNRAEAAERQFDGRTCREFIISIPNEFNLDEARTVVETFCAKLTSQGMCVEYGIHDNRMDISKERYDDNLHAHILATTRPLCDDGSFTQKRSSCFVCQDKAGNVGYFRARDIPEGFEKIPVLKEGCCTPGRPLYRVTLPGGDKVRMLFPSTSEASDGALFLGFENQLTRSEGRMVWQRKTMHLTSWDSQSQLLEWRQDWQNVCNDMIDVVNDRLEQEYGYRLEHIDCRGYAEQAADIESLIDYAKTGGNLTDSEKANLEHSDYLLSRIPGPQYHIAEAHLSERTDGWSRWAHPVDHTDYISAVSRIKDLLQEIKILDRIYGILDRIEDVIDKITEKIRDWIDTVDSWLTGEEDSMDLSTLDTDLAMLEPEITSMMSIPDIDDASSDPLESYSFDPIDEDDLWPDL